MTDGRDLWWPDEMETASAQNEAEVMDAEDPTGGVGSQTSVRSRIREDPPGPRPHPDTAPTHRPRPEAPRPPGAPHSGR